MNLIDGCSFFGKSTHTNKSQVSWGRSVVQTPVEGACLTRGLGSVIIPGIGLLASVHLYSWYPKASCFYLQTLKKCSNLWKASSIIFIYLSTNIFHTLNHKRLIYRHIFHPRDYQKSIQNKTQPIHLFLFVIFSPLWANQVLHAFLFHRPSPYRSPLYILVSRKEAQINSAALWLFSWVSFSPRLLSVQFYTLQTLRSPRRASTGNGGFHPGVVSVGPRWRQTRLFWAWHAVTNGKREIRDRQFSSAIWTIRRMCHTRMKRARETEGNCFYCYMKMKRGGCGCREIVYRRRWSGRERDRKPRSQFAIDSF